MKILHFNNPEESISYHKHIALKKQAPYVLFHHGFMSDMNGKKALAIEKFCQERGYNYIRFDNFGCGSSSGILTDQTISTWLRGANYAMDQLTEDTSVLLVGSSLGAWIAVLSAMTNKTKVIGVIALSAAFDFTEELIWNNLLPEQRLKLEGGDICYIKGTNQNCDNSYPITMDLIVDARQYLLLNKETIDISCPVSLIHGTQDLDVPCTISRRALEKFTNSSNVTLELIDGADHRLSRPYDLRIVCEAIDKILHVHVYALKTNKFQILTLITLILNCNDFTI